METQPKDQAQNPPPKPEMASCRRKVKEDATFFEDVKYHIDEFIHASMDEHKTCFQKTISKENGTNISTLPDLEGTRQRVYAPARHLSRRWRAMVVHKVYSLKLYSALRLSRRSTTVRDTADKILATTARGTTQWSRAILVNPLAKRLYRHKNTITKPVSAVRGGGWRRRKLSPVRSRVRVLGGLVPGCRRTALPELLDETADYIAALEMQVRAMTALSKILSEFQINSARRCSQCV